MTFTSAIGEIVLGWLLADLLSGIFHWWQDRCGNVEWPIIGPWLIAPQRLHHVKPLAFAEASFLHRNLANYAMVLCVGALWWYVAGFSILLIATMIGGAFATHAHYLAHKPSSANRFFHTLQEIGILQSPKGHALHHRPPNVANYCALSDFVNPVLEVLQVWRRLERLLRIDVILT